MKNKILVVEDHLINRQILVKMLSDEYDVIEASDGEEALAIIREQHRELAAMILDLLMPKMSGRELLEILTKGEHYNNLPILIATGEHNDDLESECLALGAWDFVTKPYNPIVLKLRLHNIIGRSQTYLMKRIQLLAERDLLTKLYNRRYFMKRTEEMLKNNPDTKFVMIRLDIDQFRLYNASFGSEAGDELLCQVANSIVKRMSNITANMRTYGRIESDVFCVCMPYDKEHVENEIGIAETIVQGFSSTYRLKASFGLYVIEDNNADLETIYAHTVEAARRCKNNLNRMFAYYGEEMGRKAQKAQRLTNEMDRAIRERQFQVYLQPKYSIETERPCGAEALVRWIHPEWGMVSPGEFIPVFEQNGLIVQLDYYMWESVCMLLEKWKNGGGRLYPVSVNISRVSMYNPQIVQQLVELTIKYQIPKHLLNLEITESSYMSNPDLMKRIIEELHAEGFVILMDDFGSGYSSLNTLKDIEVDILKIDMKFLPTGHNNTKSEKILASIIRMAGWLGMPVVVEGVETKEQKDFLESIGCNYVQGYFYARPMPVADYEQLIAEQSQMEGQLIDENHKKVEELGSIWASDSTTGMLLQSVEAPFIIVEYANSKIDILRMNQMYTQEFANKELNRYLSNQEYYKLQMAIDETVLSQSKGECECLFVMPDGDSRWYQVRLKFIGTIEKTSLISATFTDVTIQRLLEKELNTVFSVLRNHTGQKGSLLIIDDLELTRTALEALFEDEYHIISATDGRQGLEILKENSGRIEAILLDMMMPNMNGQEFLSYKNKMPEAAGIPVIVISSESSEEMQIRMLEYGVNDYVTKPFIPAMVKKRLKNVLEYSSRFHKLIQEYKFSNATPARVPKNLNLEGYSLDDLRCVIGFMSEVFDIVRLVDPAETTIVTIQADGTVQRDPYSCFQVWNKNVRCDNCSSMCAVNGHCTLGKFELLQDEIFYVVSQPVEIYITEEHSEKLVLEVVSKISEGVQTHTPEAEHFMHMIEETHSMIYTDPLTGAYNRRYLDEMIFQHHGQNKLASRIGIILLDLNQFKQTNDLFGHQIGDRVLKGVVRSIKKKLYKWDSVIRYGGDEFIIVLTNLDKTEIPIRIEEFRQAVHTVKYGPNDTISADADFGFSYTRDFDATDDTLTDMIKVADKMMYEQKAAHKNR